MKSPSPAFPVIPVIRRLPVWPAAIVAAAIVAGCAAPAPQAVNPFEGAPGVLGSMAQARPMPEPPVPAEPQPSRQAPQPDPRGVQAASEAAGSQEALSAAEEAYARADWSGAAQQFKRLTTIYPRNGQLWFGFGAASALSGNLQEAAAGFEAALRVDANDVRAAYNLGLVRLSQADLALNRASLHMGGAPAQVREDILRLRGDLAPLFGRSAQAAIDGTVRTQAVARVQDPARAAAQAQPGASLAP